MGRGLLLAHLVAEGQAAAAAGPCRLLQRELVSCKQVSRLLLKICDRFVGSAALRPASNSAAQSHSLRALAQLAKLAAQAAEFGARPALQAQGSPPQHPTSDMPLQSSSKHHTQRVAAQAEGQLHTHGGQARGAMRQYDLLQGFSKDPLGFFDHLLDAKLQDIRCAAGMVLPCAGSCAAPERSAEPRASCSLDEAGLVQHTPSVEPCNSCILESVQGQTSGADQQLRAGSPATRLKAKLC